MIERYDPFGQMLSLRQMMDRLMEEAFVMPRDPVGQLPGAAGPAMNVYEEGDNLVVETQLPGVKPEDIDVNIEHGTLTIRGQIRAEQERRERNYLVREHRSGSFSRSLRLPATVDPDACQATYEHGTLRLTLPKSEAARPRRISITSAGPSADRESLAGPAGSGASATAPAPVGAAVPTGRAGGGATATDGGGEAASGTGRTTRGGRGAAGGRSAAGGGRAARGGAGATGKTARSSGSGTRATRGRASKSTPRGDAESAGEPPAGT